MSRAFRFWAGLCLFTLVACSDEGDGVAEGPTTSGGTSSGGSGIADASFGGTGGSATGGTLSTGGAGGTAGSTPSGGTSTGGAGGSATDAGVDAPFVCDVSGGLDCSASNVSEYSCGDPTAKLAGKVGNAVKAVLAAHPEWFDLTQGFPCCPLTKEPGLFLNAVVADINANGACAQKDPNNPVIEMVVKLNNKCSEQWVILTSGMFVRNPPKYQGACAPAWL